LANVVVRDSAVIGSLGGGFSVLEEAVDRGTAALCAEAVGAMEAVMDLTADYLRSRKQFGQAIGKFQALQHRVADMAIAIEQARSVTLLATARANAGSAERRKAVSAAKALVGRAARLVGEAAVQLHGGMGMTDEFAVGHYFKRLTCIDMTWGNTDYHVARYGAEA
jgi:alkylation response protein AidB-like acyl-CoA dehydrogenase